MAEVKKSYDVEIRKTSICAAGKKVLEMIDDLQEGKHVPIKTVIGPEKVNGYFAAYIDEAEKNAMYGQIRTAFDEAWMTELVQNGNYSIELTSRKDNTMYGKLHEMVEKGAAMQYSDSEVDGEIKDAIKKIVDEGLATEKEMAERLKYMRDNKVDPYLILRVFRQYRAYKKPAHVPSCIYQDPYIGKKGFEGMINDGLRNAVDRYAVICEGDKSVGKNVYLETVAWLLGMPMYLITFTRQMSPSSIYGEKTTDNSASQKLFEFDHTILRRAEEVEERVKYLLNMCYKKGMGIDEASAFVDSCLSNEDKEARDRAAEFKKLQAQSASVNIIMENSEMCDWLEDGGLMCFNEMNMAEANFFASFTNQLLDGTGFIFVPGRGRMVINKDCVLFGTQNADYQGVETQNEATMSRFGALVFPQPESVVKLLKASVGSSIRKSDFPNAKLDDKFFAECQRFYSQCMTATKKGTIGNACLNIRGYVRAMTVVALSNGYTKLKHQLETHVINTCDSDDRAVLRTLIDETITL